MNRMLIATGTAILISTALVGCSSESSSGEAVGGTAPCDAATFSSEMEALLASQGDDTKLISLDGFECADGWAVTFPTIGANEEQSYTYTQVFQAEGQFWIPIEDRNTVCGTYSPDDPTAYPSDAQVPEIIWQPACNTN